MRCQDIGGWVGGFGFDYSQLKYMWNAISFLFVWLYLLEMDGSGRGDVGERLPVYVHEN